MKKQLTGESACPTWTKPLAPTWGRRFRLPTPINSLHGIQFGILTPPCFRLRLTAGYYPTTVPFLARLAADGKSLVYSLFLNQGDGGLPWHRPRFSLASPFWA
jgi:hypothetical protein